MDASALKISFLITPKNAVARKPILPSKVGVNVVPDKVLPSANPSALTIGLTFNAAISGSPDNVML